MTLLIVDDEYYSVENLKNKFDWVSFGFTDVLCAYSMSQAQRIFEKEAVHIMICDVEMPHGSGLELLQWVREKKYDTECIFLTCYARFDYASSALKLGSVDYLLKPVETDALQKALTNARSRLHQKEEVHLDKVHARYWQNTESMRTSQFWLNVIHGNILSESDNLRQALSDAHLTADILSEHYYPVLLSCSKSTSDAEWKPELFEYALKNILDESLRCSELAPAIISVSHNEFLILVISNDMLQSDLNEHLGNACSACCRILPGQFRFYVCKDDALCEAESVADRYSSLSLYMHNDVSTQSGIRRPEAAELKSFDDAGPVIDSVKEYIKKHLADDLNRNDIASAVYLSPDYLSHMFHEKTGKSLTSYITEKRIQRAQKMLSKGGSSVRDIAIACGFQNISYFSRQFKSCTGKTPQEYSRDAN